MTFPRQRTMRLLLTILAVAVVSVGGGWLLSDRGNDAPSDVGTVTLSPSLTIADPTIGTNVPAAGKLFPSISLKNLSGEDVDFSALRGKPMVVNFWFSTCEPCKREFPALLAAAASTKGNVSFVGVNPQDTAVAAQDFVKEYASESNDFIYVRDPNGELLTQLGVGTFPMTLFVDAGGVIVSQHAGEITSAELATTMQKYFGVS
ncbi:MAG: redoxin family protein [Actinobacteria bacterium]|nr:redoxin family protein [Actinomycetota bacterium]MTH93748.1 redoxin family protein [Actinomycetota bacterium]